MTFIRVDSFNKMKRSALNDGNGKQKEKRPKLSDRRMTRSASKQQQLEEEENRRIQEFPGFDAGDITPKGFGELEFESCWTENSLYPAPKEYEDMAKIGLRTYNYQNDTSYRFTKILRVYSLKKIIYAAYHITFQAVDESSTKNFEAKAGSFRDVTVVPFCKMEKGLDVAAPDSDHKQTETLSDLVHSAFIQQQEERQQLLREENRRIKERRGFDFMDIPPIVPYGDKAFEPCWSESSLYPAPKLYEDMSKIGIKKYNYENHKSYQFTKLRRVYFLKDGKAINRVISFQAEDTSVASPKNFRISVVSYSGETMIGCCMLEEVLWYVIFFLQGQGPVVDLTCKGDCYGDDMTIEADWWMFGSTPLWPVVTLASNIPSSLVSEVFKDGSQLNRGAGCDALGIEALLQVPANPTDGELQIGLDGPEIRKEGVDAAEGYFFFLFPTCRVDSFNKMKRSARNDGNGKQKEKRPKLSDRRMTRSTSKQQQLEGEENRRIQEFPGFDAGDIPPNVFGKLQFKSCWSENSPDPAPKEYEDMAKIGLETYNCQNETLYQFTKILTVCSLRKRIYAAYHITFQANDECSTKNFEAKAGSFCDVTVVPFCKLEKGLDVAAPDGNRKQTETLSDLARSAFIHQQEERQQLLREEDSRIEERRGFDFVDIPPPPKVLCGDNAFEPCWSESSLYPAPKLYEDMSKIGIKKYNCEHHTLYQFTKLLRVYFNKNGKKISRLISFQAEDTSVASHKNFLIYVVSVPDKTMICSCMLEEGQGREGDGFGDDMTSEGDTYCSSVELCELPAELIGMLRTHDQRSFNKMKRSARNDGNGKRKEMRPALSNRRMTRSASKQQQMEEEENRRIQEFPGFDAGDIPPIVFGELQFKSCWTENSLYPAPKEYEDMAKIGLETYNCQNETLYQFTKILRVYSLKKIIYAAYHITFQADDESSTKNFEAKAGSFRDVTVVPFCKLEKVDNILCYCWFSFLKYIDCDKTIVGLDVAAPDGDRKQTETLSDLVHSAFIQQQEERQQLLREEDRRIKERRGFDFMDIPPIVPYGDKAFEPCWSESSLYPAPKLYEDMSKIGIKKYNYEHHTSYQFTKLRRVYFHRNGKAISRIISFQAEDTSVASPKNFQISVVSVPDETLINFCMLEEGQGREGDGFGDDMTSEGDTYCSSVELWLRLEKVIGFPADDLSTAVTVTMGLDVAAPDGDCKQIETLSDLVCSAFIQQQEERQQLLREEDSRIEERRGFDFVDVPPPPIVLYGDNALEPCWSESSLYPAPKLYEDMSKIDYDQLLHAGGDTAVVTVFISFSMSGQGRGRAGDVTSEGDHWLGEDMTSECDMYCSS
ncbi:hypothetical protein RHSIM_Rhsim13G0218900 [Rhododendron simsii]|uniref:Uncharacterized protein n=1 Tax=Rhododendron simsii TaxID=118357 RepID=A0A834FXZ5_RHOSS|nr:hypothetical protein RHSIM_Rhsim13G0218900 [Rhododendron simsii]